MPGLIDAHTHLTFGEPTGNDELFNHRTEAYSSMLSAYNARKVLRAGVTSVLDADCLWNIGCELRDAIEAGIVEGPRMRAGGQALMTMLGGTAGRMIADEGRTGYATVVTGRDVMVNEIRRQIKYGVDWIKIMVTGLIPSMKGPEVKVWNLDELRTVCDTAHELNTKVVAHCRNSESTRDAARAGVDLIYHASYLDDEAIEAVMEAGSAMCPTFTLLGNLADYGEKVGTAPELLDVFRAEIEVTAKQLAKAHAAGVRFLAGSETGFAVTPVGEWHARELEMFVRVHGHVADGGDRRGHPQRRFRHADGGRARHAGARPHRRRPGRRRRPAADITVLQDKNAHRRGHQGGQADRPDHAHPGAPDAQQSDQVRFLAACPLTRRLALTEEQLGAHVAVSEARAPPASIDVHAHAVLALTRARPGAAGPELGASAGRHAVLPGRRLLPARRPLRGRPFMDVDVRLAAMDAAGIDLQVLSPNPITYFNALPADAAVAFARAHNDALAELVGQAPGPAARPPPSCRCRTSPPRSPRPAARCATWAWWGSTSTPTRPGAPSTTPRSTRSTRRWSTSTSHCSCTRPRWGQRSRGRPAAAPVRPGHAVRLRLRRDSRGGRAGVRRRAGTSPRPGRLRPPRRRYGGVPRRAFARAVSVAPVGERGAAGQRLRALLPADLVRHPRPRRRGPSSCWSTQAGTERLVFGTNFAGWDSGGDDGPGPLVDTLTANAERLLRI